MGADSQEVFVLKVVKSCCFSLDGQFGLMAKCLARVRCSEGRRQRQRN